MLPNQDDEIESEIDKHERHLLGDDFWSLEAKRLSAARDNAVSQCLEAIRIGDLWKQKSDALQSDNDALRAQVIALTKPACEYNQDALTVEQAIEQYQMVIARVGELEAQLDKWSEREALVCPEDFSFEEVIADLRTQLAQAHTLADRYAGAINDVNKYKLVVSRLKLFGGLLKSWGLNNKHLAGCGIESDFIGCCTCGIEDAWAFMETSVLDSGKAGAG